MANSTQGLNFAGLLSRLLGKTSAKTRKKLNSRTRSGRHHTAEFLEDRALLTLAGLDFGGGITPNHWAAYTQTTSGTVSDLTDESGAATGIDVRIDFDSLPGAYDVFQPQTSQLPVHSQSLAGLDNNYADQGSMTLTWQNLTPAVVYDVYIFAGDTFADTQQVTISDSVTGAVLTSFQQPHSANQLIVNSQPGDAARPLVSYAVQAPADSSGQIAVTIDSGTGTFFSVAGAAIGIPTAPTGVFLNEVVANGSVGGNPNEYVEIRGAAGQSLQDVYVIFVDGSAGNQGVISTGTSGVVNLSGGTLGTNGFLAVLDDAADPWSVDPAAGIFDVPGFEIADAPLTALLVHVDPINGTAPVSGQDLDTGDDGLDSLPVGWTVLDSVGILDGTASSRSYGAITFSATAQGAGESGSTFVNTGFGVPAEGVVRIGNSTGSLTSDWVAADLSGSVPDLTIVQSTQSAFQSGAVLTNHVGRENPTAASPPPDSVFISITDAFISENGGMTTAVVSRNTDTTNPLIVMLTSDDTSEATVVAMVTIPAGRTDSDPFPITAVDDAEIDGTQVVTITAAATGHQPGTDTLQVTDDEAQLTLTIADTVFREDAGMAVTTGTVTRNTPATNPLTVTLLSSDTTEATVVGSVTIPAGQTTSPVFEIDAIDDTLLDGTQVVTLTASAFGHADGVATVNVIDDESVVSVAVAADSISEGDGATATTATISRTTSTSAPLVVTLTSSDTSEATVPATVTIPAGSASVSVSVSAVDDTLADGPRRVVISAAAADHVFLGDELQVLDNETPQLTLTVSTPEISEAAGTAAATVTVRRNTDVTHPLTVTLTSDDTSEATVVGTVTIPAGAAVSPPVAIDAIDDDIIDGVQTVTISAQAIVSGGAVVSLDSAFGTGGQAPVPVDAWRSDAGIAVQPDGKVIAAFNGSSQTAVHVLRFAPDGSPDTTFGSNGRVDLGIGHGEIRRVIVQPDGKILVGGSSRISRLLADGSLDPSFGIGGTAAVQSILGYSIADFALQVDGRILVAGSSANRIGRLLANGTVDAGFGIGGSVSDNAASSPAVRLLLLPGNSFIIYRQGTDTHAEIVKHRPNGLRDAGFGLGGSALVNLNTNSRQTRGDLQVDSAGRIVGTSGSAASGRRILAFRLLADGSPDPSFGGTGVVEHDIGPSSGNVRPPQLAIQADGRLLLAASIDAADGTSLTDAAVVRLTEDGTRDPSFDDDGLLTLAMPAPRNALQEVSDIVLDPAGRLVSLNGAQDAWSVVRLTTGNDVLQGTTTIDVADDDLGKWIAEGPAPTQNGQLEPNTQPNQQVTGAIHSVLAHPTNPDVLYIGAVNGGIWKTTNATATNPDWVPQTDSLPSLSTGAMAFDPTDTNFNTLVTGTARYSSYAGIGGEGGHVYRTTNGGQTWSELSTALVGENISGIAARGAEILLTSSATGGGIFRSTDTGATFTPVVSADFGTGDNFTDLVEDLSSSDQRRVYAASIGSGGTGAIYRSDDFGSTWTRISGPVVNPEMNDLLTASNNIEMAVHPVTGRLYVAILVSGQPQGVFYSSNPSTATPVWNQMDVPVLPLGQGAAITGATNSSPIVVTSAGHGLSTGDFVVIDGVAGNTAANGFHRITVVDADRFSLDMTSGNGAYAGGGSWERVTGPNPRSKDIDETGSQGRIHFSITVDPTNDNIVYIGGDRQEQPNNPIGDNTFGGAIFRGDARIARNPNVAPSPQWSHITHDIVPSLDPNGGTANGTATHADSREMVFDANGHLIETDDGGIFRRTNPRSNSGDWFSLAGSLQVVEFHDIAYDSVTNVIMGGTQDNGTHLQLAQGNPLWTMLSGGDGGDVAVDDVTLAASNQSIRYGSSQNLGGFYRRTFDQNNQLVSVAFPTLNQTGGGIPFSPQFKTPVELNAVDPSRLLIVGGAAVYESTDMGDTIREVGGLGFSGFLQDAVAYGGMQNGTPNVDVFYVGLGDQIRVRESATGPILDVDPNPSDGSDIRDVTIDSDDYSQAFAIDSDQVYFSNNTGASWTDVTGNLTSMASNFRSMTFVATAVADAVLVGTNNGVFAAFTSALGTWFELGTGLPNVLSFDLDYDAADDILIDGTLGRGAWSLSQVRNVLPTTPDVIISDVTVAENGLFARFDVSLETPAVNDVRLELTTVSGTATAGADFSAVTASVLVPAGSTTATTTFDVPIINDFIPELPETFSVRVSQVLAGSVGDISDTGTATILDNEAALTVDIAANAISETDGPAATTATISRNSPTTEALTVTLVSSDPGEASVPATVTIPAGQASVTVNVAAVPDNFVDGTQTVVITAQSAGHIEVGDTVDVLDTDVPTLTVDISPTSVIESDGPAAATVTVTRNTPPTAGMTVTLTSSDTSEATVPATVAIPLGQLSASVSLDAFDDAIQDGNQTVTVSATSTGFVDGTGTIEVVDDETPLVSLIIDDDSIAENGGVASVTAVLNFATSVDVTVDLAISGTATRSTDYTVPGTTLTIPAGDTQSTPLAFTATDDGIDELDETVIVAISNAVNAAVGSSFVSVATTIVDDDPEPTVSIAPATPSVAEGDDITYMLSLSSASSRDVVIDLAIGGTAIGGGVDYVEPPLQVTIPAGSLSVNVVVPTIDDDVDEDTEAVILGITSVINGIAGTPSQQSVDLLDGDAPPTVRLSVTDTSISEDLGSTQFTATLSAVSGRDVIVDLTTGGTATAGIDYMLSRSQLVIPAGRLTASTVLTATPDDIDEFDETAVLQISTATNADLHPVQQAQTTIRDEDAAPTVSLSSTAVSVPENGGTFQFIASLNTVSGKDVTVNLLLKGDATEAADYTATPGSPISVQIPAGSLSVPISIATIDDTIDEFDELVVLEFDSVINAVENIIQQTSTRIIDDDALALVNLAAAPDTISEATGPASAVTVFLQDAGGNTIVSGKDIQVTLALTGTATRTADYTESATIVTIPAGSSSATVTLTPVDDPLDEDDETIVVSVSSVVNADATAAAAPVVTITDDDSLPGVTVTASPLIISENGGVATYTATLSEVSGRDVTVDLLFSGLATSGIDYSLSGTSITIPAGSLSGTLTATALADALDEFDETIIADVGTVTNATATGATRSTVLITDDDPLPTLTISAANSSVAEAAGTTAFTFTLSEISGRDITVDYSASGTATPVNDYSAPGSQITIPAGRSSVTLTLNIVDDALDEFDEDITLALTAADWAMIGSPAQQTTTIIDDDPEPVVSLAIADSSIAEAGGTTTLTATLSAVSEKDVTVNLLIQGTATRGTDYLDFGSSIFIPAGSSSASVTIQAVDDPLDELAESILVDAASVINGSWDNSQVSTVIVDDDVPTLTLSIDPPLVNESAGTGAATATLTRNTEPSSQLTVSLSSSDPGEADVPASILIPFGQTSVTFPVDVFDDMILDGTQTAVITASAPFFVDGVASIDVTDATVEVNLEVDVTTASEAAASVVTVTARTANPAIGDQTLTLAVTGTGITSGDYVLSSSTLTIPDGQTTASTTFTVVDDAVVEALVENAVITMTNLPVGLAAGPTPSQTISILDNDSASLRISDATVDEGDAGTTNLSFSVTLDTAVDIPLSVDFQTADGTAIVTDGDYAPAAGTLNFVGTAGETQTVTVGITGDTRVELDESFVVNLLNLSAPARDVTIADPQATGTIRNDDTAAITISDVTRAEGDSGPNTFRFSVTMDAEVDTAIALNFATADGTALAADNDYVAVNGGMLTFAANSGGPQTLDIDIAVNGDQKVELDETFLVNLAGLQNAGRAVTVTDSQATGTIVNDDHATISVSDVSRTEGNTGTVTFTFQATLDLDVDVPVAVDFSTADGTATVADNDYTAVSGGPLMFSGSAGESLAITVVANSDTRVELDETFQVVLSNLAAAGRSVVTGTPGTGTILNDDSASLNINNIVVTEGDSGQRAAVFTVTLTGEVDTFVSVDYGTVDDSGTTADNDYQTTTGTLTFAPNLPGTQSQTLTVAVQGDQKVELDESFFVDLSAIAAGGRNVTLAGNRGIGVIVNDDTGSIRIFDATRTEGNFGNTLLTFNVTLDAEVDTPIIVNADTQDGTATTADADYSANTGSSLTFADNTSSPQTLTFTVAAIGDRKVELDETFNVVLSALQTSGRSITLADAVAVGTIVNDDSAFLSINDVVQNEGDTGTTDFTFTVTLDGEVDVPVTVAWSAQDQTALAADADYLPSGNQTVTFPAAGGASQIQTLTVSVTGDEKVELNEAFVVNLANTMAQGRDVTVSDFQGIGTVLNDDSATISIADAAIQEGDAGTTVLTFTATLSGEVDTDVAIDYSTAEQSATTADSDFVAVSNSTITFVANAGSGPQTQPVTVLITADTKVEQNEDLLVLLSNLIPAGRDVTFANTQATGTIINDDSATVSINHVNQVEGDSGNSNFVFTVTLDHEVDTPVTVSFDTTEGTASILDSDFVPNTGNSLTFAANAGPGPQTQTLAVQVEGDTTVELDETFFVNLSSLQNSGLNVTLGNALGIGTIVNDDLAGLSITDVTVTEMDSGTQLAEFTVTLDNRIDSSVTVVASTVENTADNTDYTPQVVGLFFNGVPGESHTISVVINGDQTVELDETFFVDLTSLDAQGRNVVLSRHRGTGTILNDDSASLSIGDVQVVEGNSGSQIIQFPITLTGAVDTDVDILAQTADGTATVADHDYAAPPQPVRFPGGTGLSSMTLTMDVAINGDIVVEHDETFFVDLLNLSSGGRPVTIADGRGQGTILNDDRINVTISDATVAEGPDGETRFLKFHVTRSNTTVPMDLNFSTVNGSGLAGIDYVARNSVLQFPAGAPQTATIVVQVIGDHVQEPTENLFVNISSTTFGVDIPDSQAVGTIVQDDGLIQGQKWHDLDADGVKDPDEPGLDGWRINVLDGDGNIVAWSTTGSQDLDGDGQIDPYTERGLYTIPVNAGTWQVAEEDRPGWRRTSPNGGDALAFQTDQLYNLRFTGNLFENWGGLGERWMFGTGGWYFITPAGNLFRWNGSPRSDLSGQFIAALGPKFHATPSLLYDAQPAESFILPVSPGATTVGVDFGNVPTGSISGRKFHDADFDGVHDSGEPWLNGWTILLYGQNGELVATTQTRDIDLNGNGTIEPATERGVYQFSQLIPGQYTVDELDQPFWTRTGTARPFAAEAYRLNQSLQFRAPRNNFFNWGGRQEKWLWSRQGWHFLTPDGSIWKWDGSGRGQLTGNLVATLNPDYYQNPTLIFNAPRPARFVVDMTGQQQVGVDFSNAFAQNGTGQGNVTITVDQSVLSITGDLEDNTVAIYQSGTELFVTGSQNTTINGQRGALRFSGIQLVSASLGDGNDQLIVTGADGISVTADSGSGDDVTTIGHSALNTVTINGSIGADQIRIVNSSLGSLSMENAAVMAALDSTIDRDLLLGPNGAGHTSQLRVLQNLTVGGHTQIDTGDFNDWIILNKSQFAGNVNIDSHAGNDLVALRQSQAGGDTTVELRSGQDTLAVTGGSTTTGRARLRAGSGRDRLVSDATASGAAVTGFESEEFGNIDDLLDAILSNFQDLRLDF